jgi:hypothetical protein
MSNAGKINKVKQNNNKVKYVCVKKSSQKSSLLPDNDARKLAASA